MAIKVQKTREEFQQKLYSGIAAVNVITLNPTKRREIRYLTLVLIKNLNILVMHK